MVETGLRVFGKKTKLRERGKRSGSVYNNPKKSRGGQLREKKALVSKRKETRKVVEIRKLCDIMAIGACGDIIVNECSSSHAILWFKRAVRSMNRSFL